MNATAWKFFWADRAQHGKEMHTTLQTRAQALWLASKSHWTEPLLRIEGPNGELILFASPPSLRRPRRHPITES
jgi:hypothetical protein